MPNKFMFVSFFYFRRENYITIWFHCCGIIFNYTSHYFVGLVGTFSIQVGSKLVLSKDNKQQCFKLFKALTNRAIGFFFFNLSNDNPLYKCECESLSINKQEHYIHHLDNTQPSILSFDICSLY